MSAGSATDVAAEAVTVPVKVGFAAGAAVAVVMSVEPPIVEPAGSTTVPVNVGFARSALVASVEESAVPPQVTAVSAGSATDVAADAVTAPVKVGAAATSEVVNVGEARSALVPSVVESAVPP